MRTPSARTPSHTHARAHGRTRAHNRHLHAYPVTHAHARLVHAYPHTHTSFRCAKNLNNENKNSEAMCRATSFRPSPLHNQETTMFDSAVSRPQFQGHDRSSSRNDRTRLETRAQISDSRLVAPPAARWATTGTLHVPPLCPSPPHAHTANHTRTLLSCGRVGSSHARNPAFGRGAEYR